MKQTAVMSLLIELYGDSWSTNSRFQDFANKYLEMEKEQIIESYEEGVGDGMTYEQCNTDVPDGKKYYNETFTQ